MSIMFLNRFDSQSNYINISILVIITVESKNKK